MKTHEVLGDQASEHHLYEEAARYYEAALKISAFSGDRARLHNKLANTVFLTGDAARAGSISKEILQCLDDSLKPAEAAELLLQVSLQMWNESKTKDSLPIIDKAIELARDSGNRILERKATLRMFNCLNILGRYDSASATLQKVHGFFDDADALFQSECSINEAILACISGNANHAYTYAKRAVALAHDADPYSVFSNWQNYAFLALSLGDIRLALECAENALKAARQHHLGWGVHCHRSVKVLEVFLLVTTKTGGATGAFPLISWGSENAPLFR